MTGPTARPDRWAELVRTFGERFSQLDERLHAASRDASPVQGRAEAWVSPRTADEVRDLVRWARRHRTPLVARGGGTSLDGESVPVRGGVVVDFAAMNRILEVRPEDLLVRVEPGVINYELQTALAHRGLFYPPNPGSWESSTLGGNAATNASGFRSFRYGPTRVWVVQIEGILGTGEPFVAGHLSPKRSAGPELLPLLVGSEGTLAIFTSLTLRLAPLPEVRHGLAVPVPREKKLGGLVKALQSERAAGLSAFEWVDDRVASALAKHARLPLEPGAGALLMEVEATREAEDAPLIHLRRRLKEAGVDADPHVFADANALWRARGRAGQILDTSLGPRMREDLGVPISKWDTLLERVAHLATDEHVELITYAHLGEGNLHPNFLVDPGSTTAERLRRRLAALARELGGTVSAEHGLGALKGLSYEDEHGPVLSAHLRALKRDLDPDGVLNPGKMFDPRPT